MPVTLITHKQTQLQICQVSLNSSLSVTVAGKKNLALYVPRLNPKSKMSHFQIANLDFHAQHPSFHLALEPKILKRKGLSF